MKVYEIVFSPTGGTEKAADIISYALGESPETIDLSEADFSGRSLESDSIAVIAMPSYGGRAPRTTVERLKMIKGNNARAVAVAVYGNRAQEDTLIEIADTAKECGFEVIAGISAVAEHSIARQYASGRPNKADEKQLKDFAAKIKEKLDFSSNPEPRIPGSRPYKKAGAGLVPKASSACVKCGVCAEKCPVGAISKSDPRQTDKNICINCMRCISVCPHKARAANAMMVKAVGIALRSACGSPKNNELFI